MKSRSILALLTVSLACGTLAARAADEAACRPGGYCSVTGATCTLKAATTAAVTPAATGAPTAAVKAQTTCPVMAGNPINKKLFVDVDGKRIYVCCKGCLADVRKNGATYIKQMEAAGVTLESAPLAKAK